MVRRLALVALTLLALGAAVSWIDTKWNYGHRYLWHREIRSEWGEPDRGRFCIVGYSGACEDTPVVQACFHRDVRFLGDLDDPNSFPAKPEWEWSLRRSLTGAKGESPFAEIYDSGGFRRDAWDIFIAHFWVLSLEPPRASRSAEERDEEFYNSDFEVTVPTAVPLIVCGAWPALAGSVYLRRRWRRRYRRTHGLCLKCGYNLTGLTSPRCPECGTEFNSEIKIPGTSCGTGY